MGLPLKCLLEDCSLWILKSVWTLSRLQFLGAVFYNRLGWLWPVNSHWDLHVCVCMWVCFRIFSSTKCFKYWPTSLKNASDYRLKVPTSCSLEVTSCDWTWRRVDHILDFKWVSSLLTFGSVAVSGPSYVLSAFIKSNNSKNNNAFRSFKRRLSTRPCHTENELASQLLPQHQVQSPVGAEKESK